MKMSYVHDQYTFKGKMKRLMNSTFQETEEMDVVKFVAEVKGIPRPVVVWSIDDQAMHESSTVEIQHIRNLTTLTIRDVHDLIGNEFW